MSRVHYSELVVNRLYLISYQLKPTGPVRFAKLYFTGRSGSTTRWAGRPGSTPSFSAEHIRSYSIVDPKDSQETFFNRRTADGK